MISLHEFFPYFHLAFTDTKIHKTKTNKIYREMVIYWILCGSCDEIQ